MGAHIVKLSVLNSLDDVSGVRPDTARKLCQATANWLDVRAGRLRALLVLQSKKEMGQITKRPILMRI